MGQPDLPFHLVHLLGYSHDCYKSDLLLDFSVTAISWLLQLFPQTLMFVEILSTQYTLLPLEISYLLLKPKIYTSIIFRAGIHSSIKSSHPSMQYCDCKQFMPKIDIKFFTVIVKRWKYLKVGLWLTKLVQSYILSSKKKRKINSTPIIILNELNDSGTEANKVKGYR